MKHGAAQPRFVYFDLDDTLLDHRRAERLALADLVAAYSGAFRGHELARVQDVYHAQNGPLWHAYAENRLTKAQLKIQRFADTFAALHILDLDPAEAGTFYMTRYARHWTLREGAEVAFRSIAAQYPVGLLTNGFAEVQQAKLDQFPWLRETADAVVISEEVGYLKPDGRLFDYAATLTGHTPSEILYVGDSYRSDVQGGLAAGWRVAWYTTQTDVPSDAQAAFTFDAWRDLLGYLHVPDVKSPAG